MNNPAPTAQFTKSQFLASYRLALMDTPDYEWAHDADRLEKFMRSVETTIRTNANTWNADSEVARKVWRKLGGTGRLSYKALRALQEN